MSHLTRDLHGLTVQQAKNVIANLIKIPTATKITLIHGYNRGTALRNYIWKQMPADMRAMGITKQIQFFATKDWGRTTFRFIRANESKSSSIGDLFDVDDLLSQVGLIESDDVEENLELIEDDK